MSTGLIIAIVVVALIVIGVLVMLPRMRAAAERKRAERELLSRREAAAGEHRGIASERESRAERAEQRARMAEREAERERAEASMAAERADMHEQGRADHELIDPEERDRFEGVADADRDGHVTDDRVRETTGREPATTGREGESGQDRDDERRFERGRITDDVRDSERTNP
jgi:hypothetical protein